MQSMYELATGYKNILELVGDPSIPDEDIQAALDTIDTNVETKVSNGIALIQSINYMSGNVDTELKRLQTYKKFLARRIAGIERNYIDGLNRMGKKSVLTERGQMKIKKNPPKVIIDDEFSIPQQFIRQTITETIDKKAVKATISSGTPVPGVHLESGESLVIS